MNLKKEILSFMAIFSSLILIGIIFYFFQEFREFSDYRKHINSLSKSTGILKKLSISGCKSDPLARHLNFYDGKIGKFCPEVIEENINSNFFSFLLKEDEKIKLTNITNNSKFKTSTDGVDLTSGIFVRDIVSGDNRICFYKTSKGEVAITIKALVKCEPNLNTQ